MVSAGLFTTIAAVHVSSSATLARLPGREVFAPRLRGRRPGSLTRGAARGLDYVALPRQWAKAISFARGAPSLDIVDVDGLKRGRGAAFTDDPAGVTAYGTSIGYPPLRGCIAERHQVEPEPRAASRTARCRPTRSLFDARSSPATSVIVERPTYDRTLLALRNRGADVPAVELEHDGIDVAAVERVLAAGAAPEARPHHPHLPEPGRVHALGRQARGGFSSSLGCTSSRSSRTTLTSRCGSRARRWRRMLSTDRERVTYASPFSKTVCPGIRVGLPRRSRGADRADRQDRDQHLHLPSMVSQGIVYEFSLSGALDRSIETVKQALRERANTLCASAAQGASGLARFPSPRAAISCGSSSRVAPTWPRSSRLRRNAACSSSRARTSCSKEADSSLRLAYSGVTPAEIDEGVKPAGRCIPRGHRRRAARRARRRSAPVALAARAPAAREARSAGAVRARRAPTPSRPR